MHESHLKLTKLQLFELLFPIQWVKDVLLVETNKELDENVTYGEFLLWLGIQLKLSTTVGYDRHQFWAREKQKGRDTPFKFNGYMSRDRFDDILSAMKYTSNQKPSYVDKFWEVRELIDSWNTNMDNQFVPSWISCLDESMSKWLNKYTCPGYMMVPRKPWPFGNEYHSICCSTSGVMYRLELVEGKDQPPRLPAKQYSDLGKTVGLCLRLTSSIHGTGNVVVMDSGFCVLKAITELKKKGVFSSALIKKRQYWPRYVKGEEIKDHFDGKEPGFFDAIKGTFDNVPFYIYGMKEPDYALLFMTSFGSNSRIGSEQTRKVEDENGTSRKVRFKYPEVASLHYQHRGSVDQNNALRMYPVAIEEQCKTQRWENRVFQFLLAVTEVNCNLANENINGGKKQDQLAFRFELAEELIMNDYLDRSSAHATRARNIDQVLEHQLLSLPYKMTFRGGDIVPCKTHYIQLKCTCAGKPRVRTYCTCSPGVVRCKNCFNIHISDVVKS